MSSGESGGGSITCETDNIETVSVIPSAHTMTVSGWGNPGNILKCDGDGSGKKKLPRKMVQQDVIYSTPL